MARKAEKSFDWIKGMQIIASIDRYEITAARDWLLYEFTSYREGNCINGTKGNTQIKFCNILRHEKHGICNELYTFNVL